MNAGIYRQYVHVVSNVHTLSTYWNLSTQVSIFTFIAWWSYASLSYQFKRLLRGRRVQHTYTRTLCRDSILQNFDAICKCTEHLHVYTRYSHSHGFVTSCYPVHVHVSLIKWEFKTRAARIRRRLTSSLLVLRNSNDLERALPLYHIIKEHWEKKKVASLAAPRLDRGTSGL